MPQQKPNPYATPEQPTRERALYLHAARVYADTFRAVFVDPTTARRRFRRAADWDQAHALSGLLLHPDAYGPRCARRFASEARDPAFIYWTLRDRRPRALLMRIVDLLHLEAGKRAHAGRIVEMRDTTGRTERASAEARDKRDTDRAVAARAVDEAAAVYAHPARACRVILRVVRRHGAERARALLEQKPDFFGALRVVRHPRGFWPLLLVFCSTEEAKHAVSDFLKSYDATERMRSWRTKAGHVQRMSRNAAHFRSRLQQLVATEPPSGALAEAGRLVAVLCRRRDVDEPPQGSKGPPPIYKQLTAMLPEHMRPLIVEALKLAKGETGESPMWDRERNGAELERSLALDPNAPQPRLPRPAWEQGRDRSRGRERGGGLSL